VEIANCQTHLDAEVAALPQVRLVVALGSIAFETYWRLMRARGIGVCPRPSFGHGATYRPEGAPAIIASYHPSRQNTNTGKLTAAMFDRIFASARRLLDAKPPR
jgi:uracil-DNA glycosylase